VTVITPVFDDAGGEILFYVGSRGHHADIGGITPGSMPPGSKVVEEEGVLIDNFLLLRKAIARSRNRRAALLGRYPRATCSRTWRPARHDRGQRKRLAGIAAHGGPLRARSRIRLHEHVQDNAEEAVRRVIGVLKDGDFSYEMDNGG